MGTPAKRRWSCQALPRGSTKHTRTHKHKYTNAHNEALPTRQCLGGQPHTHTHKHTLAHRNTNTHTHTLSRGSTTLTHTHTNTQLHTETQIQKHTQTLPRGSTTHLHTNTHLHTETQIHKLTQDKVEGGQVQVKNADSIPFYHLPTHATTHPDNILADSVIRHFKFTKPSGIT